MLLGLSILLASLSFLCYRHPPASWVFLAWLSRPELREEADKKETPTPTLEVRDGPAANNVDNAISVIGDYLKELGAEDEESSGEESEDEKDVPRVKQNDATPTKAESDRKAMPPPPPAFKKPTIPVPSRNPPPPTFNLQPSTASDAVPSFPAMNSAQRAGGGRGPPRLAPMPVAQPPLRSPTSSLMTPPMRSPLPNRSPMASPSGLAPPPTHSAIPSKPSKKVLLSPGHSPLDWARLTSSPSENLRGVPASTPYLRVPPSLLKQMTGRKGKDAWTILGGKVYNITPYLPYHPGGEPDLMKCAARDGTKLFGEVHPWVNYEGMLESCMVGIAVAESEVPAQSSLEEMD